MHPARRRGEASHPSPRFPDAGGECRAPSPENEPRGGEATPLANDSIAEWESLWIDLGGEG
jgi:hypothetical protein